MQVHIAGKFRIFIKVQHKVDRRLFGLRIIADDLFLRLFCPSQRFLTCQIQLFILRSGQREFLLNSVHDVFMAGVENRQANPRRLFPIIGHAF